MEDVVKIDWHLEDSDGLLHKAYFVKCTSPNDTVGMSWDKRFSWANELDYANKHGFSVYKVVDSHGTIHGGISLKDAGDHVYVEFLESATHNRSDNRRFVNVARLLIAFAGQRSIEIGAQGYLALEPKEGLDEYYKTQFQAYEFDFRKKKLGIPGAVTNHLIHVYYK